MPRRNDNARRGRRTREWVPGTIDWDRIGRGIAAATPDNEFVRHLTGFGAKTRNFLLRHGFEEVAEEGFVPVTFTGISQAPKTEIPSNKASAFKTRGGLVGASLILSERRLNEAGLGTARIRQVNAPRLDGHDSANRLNVTIGSEGPVRVNVHELTAVMAGDCALSLSRVMEINGLEIGPDRTATSIAGLWHHAPAPRVNW